MRKNKWIKSLFSVVLAVSMVITPITGVTPVEQVKAAPIKNENDLRLWYTKPVSEGTTILTGGGFGTTEEDNRWQQLSLPIGNSFMGANVYGEIGKEHLTFNHKTLWSGGPSESRPDYNGGNVVTKDGFGKTKADYYKEIQQLFKEGKNEEASVLCNQLTGISDGYGAYQAWGDIYLDFGLTASKAKNYVRDLDLRTAIASVNFDYDDTNYNREYFISYPDNVLAMKLTATNSTKINFDVSFPANKEDSIVAGKNDTTVVDANEKSIVLKGTMKDNQLKFYSQLNVENAGGTVAKSGTDKLRISDADSVIIYVSAGTDYKNEYPNYRTNETDAQLAERVNAVVANAVQKGYDRIKEDHITDYQTIFNRLDLDLGQLPAQIPTDELLIQYKAGTNSEEENRALEVMLFQYGRYLTIASSREGDLPSNLQGVWNNRIGDANRVPWGSDYHMNVNLQMNYWPTYSTNMAECAIPLIEYVDSLREPGRVTAETYTGVKSDEKNPENGFTAHTQNTPFGWTCPGWDFSWGWSPAAVPWILQNCWEYYEYTGDVAYMKENIYPMLREEAVYYDQILVEDNNGNLVSAPAYSPEHGPRTMGNTYEQSLIWQLYEDAQKAAKVLGVDEEKQALWKETQSKLNPIEIGESGQIKEWREETTLGSIGERGHRHMSHLLGLFPGDLISVDNADYMDAAIVSLNDRGMNSTGWGMGQRINAWARTGQGNKAYQLIQTLFSGGVYPNLWDSHPPFQIDGNFGYTSGVAEMLLQSNMDYINILPALPDVWSKGNVDGLVARGNFEVGITWENQTANEVRIHSKNGGLCTLQMENAALANIIDKKGNAVEVTILSDNRIAFDTEKGETFKVSNSVQNNQLSAPSKVQAYQLENDTIRLEWDLVEGATSYNVYRQVGSREFSLLSNVTELVYIDEEAYQALGKISYKVCAVDENGIEGKASDKTSEVLDVRKVGIIDDRDSLITYSSEWGTYDYDIENYNGTMHFIEDTSGGEWFEMKFVGTGIKIIVPANMNSGILKVIIDGKDAGEADCYEQTRTWRKTVYEKLDLEPGLHTIRVEATGTHNLASVKSKIEFDAFEVINNAITSIESITVDSKTGASVIGAANGTIQMVATILPEELSNAAVTWSVNNETIATITETGLLQAKDKSGVVTVTAEARDGSGVVGQKEITIQLPGVAEEENILNSNGAIQYVGSNGVEWTTWPGDEHYSKQVYFVQDANAAGSYIEYIFNGVGIEVYTPTNNTFDMVKVYIDGQEKEIINVGEPHDQKQQRIYKSDMLENKEHTIKLEVVKREGKVEHPEFVKVEFDYFKVLKSSASVDKAALQAKLQEVDALQEKSYSEESWKALKTTLQTAIIVMNDNNATEENIADAVNELQAAITNLVPVEAKPDAVTNLKAVNIEDNAAILIWNSSKDALEYQVYNGENVVAEHITNVSYEISNLNPDTTYTFKVIAIDSEKKKSDAVEVTFTTKSKVDKESPKSPTELTITEVTDNSMKVIWKEATDDIGVVKYKVYVNGELKGQVEECSYILENLQQGTSYGIRVVAIDASGKESIPASITGKTTGIIEEVKYQVTVKANSEEGGTVTGSAIVIEGEEVTVSATPAEGYRFLNWTVEEKEVSKEAKYTFKVTKDVELIAQFEKEVVPEKTYQVTVKANPEEGGVVTGSGSVKEGKETTVSAVPAEGYRFANWTVEGKEVSKEAKYTFKVTKDVELIAQFEKEVVPEKTYQVTVKANLEEGGVVTGNGTVTEGKETTVSAVPAEGYRFANWTVEGKEVSKEAKYTFKVTKDVELVAQFEKEIVPDKNYQVTVKANPEEGGAVTGNGTVTEGKETTVSATPAEGYTFVNWTVEGKEVSKEAKYTFKVTKDVELVAQFKKISTETEEPTEVPTVQPTKEPTSPPIPPIEIPTTSPTQPTVSPGQSTPEPGQPTVQPTEKPDNMITEEDENTKTNTTTTVSKEKDKIITETIIEVTDKKTGAVTETIVKKEEEKTGIKVGVTRKSNDLVVNAAVEVNEKKEVISSDITVKPNKTETTNSNTTAKVSVSISDTAIKEIVDVLKKQAGVNLTAETLKIEIVLPNTEAVRQINNNKVKTTVISVQVPEETAEYQVGNLVLPGSVLTASKDSYKNLKTEVRTTTGEFVGTWSFQSKMLAKNEENFEDLNLALQVAPVSKVKDTEVITDILEKDKNNTEAKSILVSLETKKELPVAATINIAVAKKSNAKAGDTLYLYVINEKTKKLEAVPNNTYKVSQAGNVAIHIIKGGNYVLLTKKPSLTVGVPLASQVKVETGKSITGIGEQSKIKLELPSTLKMVSSFSKKAEHKAIGEVKASYQSGNTKIATVAKDGTITSKKKGSTIITTTLTFADGKKKAVKTKVTVK